MIRKSLFTLVQFSSVDRLCCREHESLLGRETLQSSFPQEAIVSSSGKGRDVYSLMLFFQLFLCRPRRRQNSKVLWWMVLERRSRHHMPEPCKFLSRDSSQNGFLLTHTQVDLAPHTLALCSKWKEPRSFLMHFAFSKSASRVHVHRHRGGWRW